MPRYIIERAFAEGMEPPTNGRCARAITAVIENIAEAGVHCIYSYITPDRTKTYCVYDAPTPEAIQSVASADGLPADSVREMRAVDAYFLC